MYQLTDDQKYCRHVSDELTAYYEGRVYRGDDDEPVVTDDPTEDQEQLSLYDYLDDVLDVEYLVLSDRKTLRGVKVYIGLGGPTIWIDTAIQEVVLSWGTEKTFWSILPDVADEITSYYQEIWDLDRQTK